MTFQLIAIISFAVLATTGMYHRIKAKKAGGSVSRMEEGTPIMVILRVFGLSMWFGLLTYLINPDWMAWSSITLPVWLRWTGTVLVIIAIPLVHWMFRSLGNNVTDTVAIRKEHQLVTKGPYKHIRHPMYSFSVLMFMGYALLAANWFIGVTGLVALLLLGIRMPIEESKLEEAFGDAYREYAKRTARFIPGVV